MIKIINKTNEKLSFKTDMSISLANAIRRSVNYIPLLAVDSLEISKNDSALYDELIAHRVGLVPLKNENLKLPSDCDCGKEEGCGKCRVSTAMTIAEMKSTHLTLANQHLHSRQDFWGAATGPGPDPAFPG